MTPDEAVKVLRVALDDWLVGEERAALDSLVAEVERLREVVSRCDQEIDSLNSALIDSRAEVKTLQETLTRRIVRVALSGETP